MEEQEFINRQLPMNYNQVCKKLKRLASKYFILPFILMSIMSFGQNIPKEILSIDEFPNHTLKFPKVNFNKDVKIKLDCYLSFIKSEQYKAKGIVFIVHEYELKKKEVKEYIKMKNKILKYLISKDDIFLEVYHKYFYGKEANIEKVNSWYFEIQLIYEFKNTNGELFKGIYGFRKCDKIL